MTQSERVETDPIILEKQEELSVSVEEVPIASLRLTPQLREKFPKEYDPAMIRRLGQAIKNGTITPHALVVKEVYDGDGRPYLELLHKPAVVFALDQFGTDTVGVIIIHNNTDFDLDTASDRQLLYLGERGALIDHFVRDIPLSDVIVDGSVVDEEHRDILKDQLATGQQVNIWVRPRLFLTRILHDIVDGYHRSAALTEIGVREIEARLSYGMTDEELYDERVRAAARSAKAVKLSRMITSMQQSYSRSEWFKYGLRLSQILSLANSSDLTKQPGKNLGLPEDVAQNAIRWVVNKAKLWDSDVGTLYQQIRSAEDSFPEIIDQVRTSQGGGHIGDGVFNPVKFYAMVEKLPNNLTLQRIMVRIIRHQNLNTDQVRVVSQALALIENNPELIELLESNPCDLDVLSGILGGKVAYVKGKMVHQPKAAPPTDDEIPLSDIDPDTEVLTSHLDEIATIQDIVEDASSNTIFQAPEEVNHREELEPDTGIRKKSFTTAAKPIGHDESYNVHRTIRDYELQISNLEQALDAANTRLARGGGQDVWYKTLATLTPREREIMRYVSKARKMGIDIPQINTRLRHKYNLTGNQVTQLKRSALAKWSMLLESMLQAEYDNII